MCLHMFPMVQLLLPHHLVAASGCSKWWGTVVFSSYITIAKCYSEVAYCYNDIVSVSQFVPANTVTIVMSYITVVHG